MLSFLKQTAFVPYILFASLSSVLSARTASTSHPITSRQDTPFPPYIAEPANGTALTPGQNFTFSYIGVADYGRSSYAYHLWLFADDVFEKPFSPSETWTNGYYFGKFDYANYPAIPYEKHPAPSQFTTPDFSKANGGWGDGKVATDHPMRLVVLEEWADGFGSVGHNVAVFSDQVIYNATGH
ncbi:hypothetical protein K474DRAFT_1665276 [Panus rudis PR-1116 ss-1]|nr:hypothetical protein K474DRAFT_1665276 [Panus rudis PR-1116 ss-1]